MDRKVGELRIAIILLPLGVGVHMFACHHRGGCGYVVPEAEPTSYTPFKLVRLQTCQEF